MVEMEAVELCPFCENENVYPNWDTEKQGYAAICQHCGAKIMLCDECVHSDDFCGCDWEYENDEIDESGFCFRGRSAPKNK